MDSFLYNMTSEFDGCSGVPLKKYVAAQLNEEEYRLFQEYAKKFGLTSRYEIVKHMVKNSGRIFNETPDNKFPAGYSMPDVVVESMEKEAERINKMQPESAQSELSKILGRKNSKKAIDAYTMYGADRYGKTLFLLYDRREPPQLAVWKLIDEFRLWMLATRAKGGNTLSVLQENWKNHLQHGRFTKSEIDRSNEGRPLDLSSLELERKI